MLYYFLIGAAKQRRTESQSPRSGRSDGGGSVGKPI